MPTGIGRVTGGGSDVSREPIIDPHPVRVYVAKGRFLCADLLGKRSGRLGRACYDDAQR